MTPRTKRTIIGAGATAAGLSAVVFGWRLAGTPPVGHPWWFPGTAILVGSLIAYGGLATLGVEYSPLGTLGRSR